MTTTIDTKKTIECPECGSAAELSIFPNPWAGMFTCLNEDCGAEDWCQHHGERHTEEVEVDDSHPDRRDGYTYSVYICDDCEQDIPLDQADPAEDALDDFIDWQMRDERDNCND